MRNDGVSGALQSFRTLVLNSFNKNVARSRYPLARNPRGFILNHRPAKNYTGLLCEEI